MIPEVSGMVRNGTGHIWNVLEGVGMYRKVMEGSGRVRNIPDYFRESVMFHNRCIYVALRGKEFPSSAIRIWQRRSYSSRFCLTETYRNPSKLWGCI